MALQNRIAILSQQLQVREKLPTKVFAEGNYGVGMSWFMSF